MEQCITKMDNKIKQKFWGLWPSQNIKKKLTYCIGVIV
jgi:hypothetical protein